MATWRTVTKVYMPTGLSAREPEERTAFVNMDLVAAIIPYPASPARRDGALSKLIWHTTSPRCEWDVKESAAGLLP